LPYGPATPYLPVLEALKASCGITDADTPDVVVERVSVGLREVGMDPARSGPYLFHLLGLQEGVERLATLEPAVRKARVFETLRQMWVGRSRQLPLVIVVEDLQWIDTISEEFFVSLAEVLVGSPLLLGSTCRAGYRPPRPGGQAAARDCGGGRQARAVRDRPRGGRDRGGRAPGRLRPSQERRVSPRDERLARPRVHLQARAHPRGRVRERAPGAAPD